MPPVVLGAAHDQIQPFMDKAILAICRRGTLKMGGKCEFAASEKNQCRLKLPDIELAVSPLDIRHELRIKSSTLWSNAKLVEEGSVAGFGSRNKIGIRGDLHEYFEAFVPAIIRL